MAFNQAVYAMRENQANHRQAATIKLDAQGNPTNTDAFGNPFTIDAVIAAQDAQSFAAYRDTMNFLVAFFGEENDTQTVKRFDFCKSKIQDRAHAEEMKEKLVTAALNGSDAALIAYASVSLYLNPYAPVDFGWHVNGSDLTPTDDFGYQTRPVTSSFPSIGITLSYPESDYEGFAPSIRVMVNPVGIDPRPAAPAPAAPITAPVAPAPAPAVPTSAPAAPITAPVAPAPAPAVPTSAPAAPISAPAAPAPVTLQDADGRVLVATPTGWKAESVSSPGTFHTTTPDGTSCTCPGHQFHGHCWHVKAVLAHQSAGADVPVTEAPSFPPTRTHNGIFTADLPDGHRTFKIKRQKETSGFMPGERVAYLLTGSEPDHYASWTSFGVFRDDGTISLWKSKRDGKWQQHAQLLANPASQPDVRWNCDETCIFCNRTLTRPESAKRGYGPTCAANRGLPYGKEAETEDDDAWLEEEVQL